MNLMHNKSKKKEEYPGLVTIREFLVSKKIAPGGVIDTAKGMGVNLPEPHCYKIRIGQKREFYKIEDMENFYSQFMTAKAAKLGAKK